MCSRRASEPPPRDRPPDVKRTIRRQVRCLGLTVAYCATLLSQKVISRAIVIAKVRASRLAQRYLDYLADYHSASKRELAAVAAYGELTDVVEAAERLAQVRR